MTEQSGAAAKTAPSKEQTAASGTDAATSAAEAPRRRSVRSRRDRRSTEKKPGNVRKVAKSGTKPKGASGGRLVYPKDPPLKCLRIPTGILDQNAGKACSDRDAAAYAKVGWSGEVGVEISSAIKYGLLERPSPGKVIPTERARRIARPQTPQDRLMGLREAVADAPTIGDFYRRYRGENLPDDEFLVNAAVDSFGVPKERADSFISVFKAALQEAELLEEAAPGKPRVRDATRPGGAAPTEQQLKKLAKGTDIRPTDACFVVMPFAPPLGDYFSLLFKPAIHKAGLQAVRADADIFGTGKIIDQIWTGIVNARVLVAELTGRNPNVLYELGIAHALEKPVVLVSSNEDDVPFDVRHVRVIYYDVRDPFWGEKLIEKVAENILSALRNPAEAVLFRHGSQAG